MDFSLPPPVQRALDRLEKAGHQAYAVGGCVRDHVLGLSPHDYDICTSALPRDMQAVFADAHTVETGLKHGTLTVILDHMPLEITTFRLDGEYLDGRHPVSVQFTPRVEDDLARRDFTINAMAYSPRTGLVDPFGGREDCRDGRIRCVGTPAARFREDALRILRALRFSARLGFPVEAETARALREKKDTLAKISRERVAAELTGLLLGEHAAAILTDYPDVLATAVPELSPVTGDADAWQATVQTAVRVPGEAGLRWAALLCRLSPERAEEALKTLKMPNRLMADVVSLIAWQDAPLRQDHLQEALMRLGPERLSQLLVFRQADGGLSASLRAMLDADVCYTLGQLAVGGREMAALGLQGKAIGDTLNALLLRVVRGEIPNERQALLAAAREITG